MVRVSGVCWSTARRVVVTGLGLVTPLGCGSQHVWDRLCRGDVGIVPLAGPEFAGLPSRVAGLVPEGSAAGQLNLADHFAASERRSLSRATCLAVVAAEEAARSAGWRPRTETEQERTAVCIGMASPDLEDIAASARRLQERGARGVSPHFAARILHNMPAGLVAIRLRCRGPNHAASTACATGAHAIGDALRLLRAGAADAAFCGAADAGVSPLAVAGFSQMRALSVRSNAAPAEASRPFDAARDGFVMAEGAGVLLLETLEHARRRGGRPIAELLGCGLSGDARHVTAPCEDGDGARRAMAAAMRDAGVSPGDVTHVNAHATGTPLGDRAELGAVAALLAGSQPLVTSCKGSLGHLLAAAGAVEAAATALSCRYGLVPPTANLAHPEPVDGVRLVVPPRAAHWRTAGRRVALKNSFGFGGTNTSLCFAEFVE
ncbi:3-oxoacyl-[acyl-carrier-protein] synthase, mitochondrial-like [Amphibalanus amphitrite]|uniref:3-oxoacyl-[acyl-carrier-protein] synthase, mitochondrial-like n=1 Tax=Amphibalanus amphitrite TaxID=1232801 RepID=UPI001C91B9C1|nr:3-oxoacyl-[acyl-carrier-protein] synthase, mitochondrial-like [Amphibalanus amphitrite]XP_043226711.1 3-oxoacyl-[acyl-carrier-protein] synthase, mitochondrial-like [Amphibalanus amphitrite]XP_043226712.1 3-oxoacyl-[acyl-carrier-protein] synthase, mitochondrial-like [Amphibalanus amphitrite]XP_043226713.1 3-oxoacyl-[acyl-carrier-protein] synthase, mitochondrial-like [Amphibalanus amphitrite]